MTRVKAEHPTLDDTSLWGDQRVLPPLIRDHNPAHYFYATAATWRKPEVPTPNACTSDCFQDSTQSRLG